MGMLICFLLPATSNKMPSQSHHSTRINGNQLRAESWENCFFWKMKSQLGSGDWMTFYYSREMIHRAEAGGFEGGGQVLDWACGSRRVLFSGFSWCVFLFFWLPVNLWAEHMASRTGFSAVSGLLCALESAEHLLQNGGEITTHLYCRSLSGVTSCYYPTGQLLTVSCHSWELPEPSQTSFSWDL